MLYRLLVCALAALLLSGCYAHDTAVVLNADGSGTVRVTAGINKLYAQRLESGEVESIQEYFESLAQDLPAEWQAQSALWDDGQYVGSEITLTFIDPTMLQDQLNQVLALSQSSGYNDFFTSFVVQQQNDELRIITSLVGANQDADGEELPSGPEGASRLGWSVTFPQLQTAEPSDNATFNGNQVAWVFQFSDLPEGHELELVAQGLLAPGPPPATPTNEITLGDSGTAPPTLTSTPTLQPTAAVTATPVAPSATTRAVAQVPTVTLTSAPLETPVEQATQPIVPTNAPAATTVAAPEPTSTPLPTTAIAVAAVSPSPLATATESSELVAAAAAPVRPSTVPEKARTQAYVPMVASGSDQPATELQAVPEQVATSRDAAENGRYQNLLIAFLLLCSALCFGYVGIRRLTRRRARAASSEAAAPPDRQV